MKKDFIFNDVKYDSGSNFAFYEVDSSEGAWNTGKDEGPNLGHKPRHKEGYFPLPPVDSMHDVRTEMVMTMQDIGLTVEAHHHEVSTGGQQENNSNQPYWERKGKNRKTHPVNDRCVCAKNECFRGRH